MYLKRIIDTNLNIKFKGIKLNSKDIKRGDIFIPFPNRYNHIDDIVDKCLIITDKPYKHKNAIVVSNLETEIINIFDKYYNYPLRGINLIGVTGTDGKTTVSSILKDLLNSPTIGTNGFLIGKKTYPLANTTPSIDILYSCFNKVRNKKYKNLVMEVSSEAYLTKRIGNLNFSIAILTNITRDHLDKHKSLDNYINSKLELFKHSKIAILNKDSKYYNLFKENSHISYSYGFNKESDLRILEYKLLKNKSFIVFKYKNKIYKTYYPLLGKFNVLNIASSILTMLVLGYSMKDIKNRLNKIKPVKGRMEIMSLKPFIVLDYAHTEKATYCVLNYFSRFNKDIITILGAAGDRYKEKRKLVGEYALKYSKLVIFTMDDPRDEDPCLIIKDMINRDYSNYLIILDRKEAIKYAINNYQNDLILVLGKGRDNYMLVNNQKIKYSDYKTIKKDLKRKKQKNKK